MKILFYSVKGGQGKTTHSISYAKYKDALYLTNDFESGTLDIYADVFEDENQMQIIKSETQINFENLKKYDVVFDFGGWVDEKIEKITKNVDVVVVPVFFQSMADLMPCIKTIKSLLNYNSNIVIIINNTDKEDAKELNKHLESKFENLKVFVVNKSKYINRLANEGKTIFDLIQEGGIVKFNLNRSGLMGQINNLYSYLDNF